MIAGMTEQIAVSPPGELVDFVNAEVKTQHHIDRAAVFAAALEQFRDRVIEDSIVAGYGAVPDSEDEDLDEFLSLARVSTWGESKDNRT